MIRISFQKKLNLAGGEKVFSVKERIPSGAFVVIYGPSGAGKTTFLRIVSGLLKPEWGQVDFDGEKWLDTDRKINLPVQKRSIGFVFQDLALFPNMTVEEHVLFAAGKPVDKEHINRLLKMTGLASFKNRKPQNLSGGQRQRLAIIRALARKPRLLLLDEPFSSLDTAMHNRLRKELEELHRKMNLTALLVSHDPIDIYGKANRVIEIENGTVINSGRPEKVFDQAVKGRQIGKILQIKKGVKDHILEIAVENETLNIPASQAMVEILKVGMQICIHYENFQIHLYPLAAGWI